jgi:hypothetical protein
MAQIYYKTFKVPTWIIIDLTDAKKKKMVKDWLNESGAREQYWPSNDFNETLDQMRSKGHTVDYEGKVPLHRDTIIVAATEHIKKLDPVAKILTPIGTTTVNRFLKSKDDATAIFDKILELQTPTILSFCFRVAEKCHKPNGENEKAWFTEVPCNASLISKISDRVVTIGEGENFSLDLSGKSAKTKIVDTLTEFFSNTGK